MAPPMCEEATVREKPNEKYPNFGTINLSTSDDPAVPENASKAFEQLLAKAGDLGRFQWRLMVICGFCGVFTGFHNMAAMFLAATPDHWCEIPYFAEKNLTLDKSSLRITVPRVRGKEGTWRPSKCEYFDYDYSTSVFHSANGADYADVTAVQRLPGVEGVACSSWVYDGKEYTSTIVTEWDLVCDNRWLMSSIQSTFMIGILTGAVVFSAMSDRMGRRYSSLIGCWVFLASSVAVVYVNSLEMLLILRFIVAGSGHGIYLVNYVLLMECVGLKGRHIIGNFFHILFPIGFFILAFISYHVRDWRNLQLWISLPSILLLSYHWLLPESPRWLLTHGKEEEALKVLQKIARTNGNVFPGEEEIKPLLTVIRDRNSMKEPKTVTEKINSLVDIVVTLVRTPNMRRRSLIVFYLWFVASMLFYGLSFIGANINASVYYTAILSATAEVVGISSTVVLLLKFGRRSVISINFIVAGVTSVIILMIPAEYVFVNLSLVTLSKLAITASFVIAFLFSAELVPTQVRNISLGIASMWARIGSAIAPFIVDLLGDIYFAIPSTIFGVLSLIAGLLSFLLPETGNRRLPESVEEIEAMPR